MKNIEKFQDALLTWFDRNKRDLPWRKTYLPYHVWISEVMLQQTQMDRVVDYFKQWMKRFPDVDSVGAASEEEILQLWEGLGYYSRARNLHKTAQILSGGHGELPDTYKELLSLPGIGRYTAGAILSIAFNQEYPIVDANIERVFSRIFNIASPVKDKENSRFIWEKAAELIPSGKARYFNQALMELGALICLPLHPQCNQCPISSECVSLHLGIVDERPVPGKSTDIINIKMATGVLFHEGRVFIQKRPEHGIWANLWEFPGGRIEKGEKAHEALVREFKEETEFDIQVTGKIQIIKHNYTRYRVDLHCYRCALSDPEKLSAPVLHEAQRYKWVSPDELHEYAFPSAHRKLIRFLCANDLFS